MSITFSGKELLDIAIQIEKNGFAFYSRILQKMTDNKARELISWLAQEEKGHIRTFEEILSRLSPVEPDMSPSEKEEYTLYLKALADARVFVSEIDAEEEASKIMNERDAIQMAIEFEKDSLLFLSAMRMLMRGPDITVVEELQKEEMSHLKKLIELKGGK